MEEWSFIHWDYIIFKANKDRIDLMLQKIRVDMKFLSSFFAASVLVRTQLF